MAKPNIKRHSGSSKPQWELYNVKTNPEWQLAEGYAEEYTDITGIKITYYQRNNEIQPDVLYGETQDIEFLEGKETKILYEVGEIPTLYSMFGMMATDQIIAHIPQCIYSRDVSKTELPKPGDLIKVEWYRGDFSEDDDTTKRTFEITHVAQDQSIFQLRSLVYVMYLIPYRYSEESQSAKDASSDLDTTYVGISAYGDNNWIDTQSDILSAYTSVDTKLYGY